MAHGWNVDPILFCHLQDVLVFFALDRLTIEFERNHGVFSLGRSADFDRIKLAAVITDSAFDALVLMDAVRLLFISRHSLLGAFLETDVAAGAGFRVDFILEQRLADAGRAFLVPDMGFVFVPEVQNVGQNWVGGGCPEAAE
jgi:hypothetical protein